MNFLLHLLIYFAIYAIVAQSLNLIVGYAGMLTLAHAGFFAIGGYVYANLTLIHQWDFIPATFTGALIVAVISGIVSMSSWRLQGDFFVLATLSIQALVFNALNNWTDGKSPLGSIFNLTNGTLGIAGIPHPRVFGWQASTQLRYALLALLVASICVAVMWRLTASPWGRLLKLIRDDELAARGLGKNTRLAKVEVMAIASAMAAIAGALYAGYVRYLDPSSASLNESILMLSMIIIGGLGTMRGSLVGAGVLVLLPELLRFLLIPGSMAANLRLLIYGVMLVVMMQIRPQGIAGEYKLE